MMRAHPKTVTRRKQLAPRTKHATHPDFADEPPVIARLVAEIRSDGSRTIERGTLEDVPNYHRT
jgi:hypothetical protein